MRTVNTAHLSHAVRHFVKWIVAPFLHNNEMSFAVRLQESATTCHESVQSSSRGHPQHVISLLRQKEKKRKKQVHDMLFSTLIAGYPRQKTYYSISCI